MSLEEICRWFGISRQAHYQQRRRIEKEQEMHAQIIEMVREMRQRHPRMGGRKLLHELTPHLEEKSLQIGRDRFFDLLAQNDLLVPPLRQQRRTTWPGLWRCPNRLTELTLTRVQQVWVCDITYLETEQGFCYLCLVTDAFSRFIVGFDLSTSLAVEGAMRTLTMAMAQASGSLRGLIHHSDHGIQYTCPRYRHCLSSAHILPSMGEVGNCYDNALAERVNGILKIEYLLGGLFVNFDHAFRATSQAIWLYNYERPHFSLDLLKPIDVHSQCSLSYSVQ